MAIQNSTLRNRTPSWNSKKRYKVNESVYYNGIVWQNITGSNSEPGAGFDWLNVNGGGSGGATSNLLKEQFEFVASQTFTLANNYAQVYVVMVSGQGGLHTSQYSLIAPNQVEILDTLETGDFVIILYSTALAGVQPYYTQAQVDALLAGLIPLSGTDNPVIGKIKFLDADGNETFYIGKDNADDKIGVNYDNGTYKSKVVPQIENIEIQGDKPNFRGLVGFADYSSEYNDLTYVQKIYVAPSTGTGTEIPLTFIGGYYGNMASANTSATFTTTGSTVGAFAIIRINRATQPTVTGATLIDGADFIADNDMHLVIQYFGDVVQYYFLRL